MAEAAVEGSVKPRKSYYNPNKIHRKVRRIDETPDGIVHHLTKSFTIDDDKLEYHPLVDTYEGAVTCDCEDFFNRCAKHEPDVLSHPNHLCKHIIRAIVGCHRRDEIRLPASQLAALNKAWDRTTREKKEVSNEYQSF